jgi:non-homologous end joining protein Ku
MGKMMIEQFAVEKFDKSKYSDNFIDKLNAAVEKKLAGGTITEVEQKVNNSSMADSLRESLIAMGVPKEQIDAMIAKAQGEAPVQEPVVVPEPVPVKATRSRKKAVVNG